MDLPDRLPFSAMSAEAKQEWIADCLKYRGRILVGEHSHWCFEWDELVVDETCDDEYACCICFTEEEKARFLNGR